MSKLTDLTNAKIIKLGGNYLTEHVEAKTHEMYWTDWELDYVFWQLEDGRLFKTGLRRLEVFTKEAFIEYRTILQNNLKNLEGLL